MRLFSLQRINDGNTWAMNFFFLFICSVGIVINNVETRTDIFFTIGIIPFSASLSFGVMHMV